MDIVKLPFGERAPIDSDCISIEHLNDGRFRVSGTVLSGDESTALVGIVCDEAEAAEAQGLAWMAGCAGGRVYVANIPAVDTDDA